MSAGFALHIRSHTGELRGAIRVATRSHRRSICKDVSVPIVDSDFHDVASAAFDMGLKVAAYFFTARAQGTDDRRTRHMIVGVRFAPSVICNESFNNWESLYFDEQLFKIDPIHRTSLDRTMPFWWGIDRDNEPTRILDSDRALTACQVDMFRRGWESTGVRSGVTVPLHSAYGGIGNMGFLSDEPIGKLKARLESETNTFLGIAHRFHDRVLRNDVNLNYDYEGASLTEREIECLSIIASGKTIEEAAAILDISYGTVRFHVRSACTKLHTSNRTKAVARAAYLGMLGVQ